MTIETDNNEEVSIEAVTIQDAEELLEIYKPYIEKTAITFEYDFPSLEEFQERIRNISEKYPYIKAVNEDGTILGYAYAGVFKGRKAYDWSVETTIYLKMEEKGHGLGKALYEVLEDSLKEMGILNMNACIAMPKGEDPYLDDGSIHFHEKMGFRPVGVFHDSGYKFHTWYDMIWMEKMIGEHTKEAKDVAFGAWKI